MLLGLMTSRKTACDCVSFHLLCLGNSSCVLLPSVPACVSPLQPTTLCYLVANAPSAEVATVSTSMQQPNRPHSLPACPCSHFSSSFSTTVLHPSGIFAEFSCHSAVGTLVTEIFRLSVLTGKTPRKYTILLEAVEEASKIQ